MKKALTFTTALAIAMIATPASAQVLGGGGSILGGAGGSLDSTIGGIDRTVSSTTRGTLDARGSTEGNTRVNRRRGRVEADRRADASLTGDADQLLSSPLGDTDARASGSGNASGSGSASAQLVGTDAVRGTVGEVRNTATGTVGSARSTAAGVAGSARATASGAAGQALGAANGAGSITGSGSASGSGNGSATGSLMPTMLATEGSGASQGEGSFAVAPGMDVLASNGARIGEVREIVADQRGQVQQVLVSNGNAERLVPAGNFTAAGDALVMGNGSAEGSTQPTPQPAPATEDNPTP
ncbi:PRC-barrel domain-containing protein [Erythrobacter alti]|uniref:PRC-barrel domain-containing protein n=1 Tax=Erythrobacter alti TaxID=1896145 RepID=UPI0030F44ECE